MKQLIFSASLSARRWLIVETAGNLVVLDMLFSITSLHFMQHSCTKQSQMRRLYASRPAAPISKYKQQSHRFRSLVLRTALVPGKTLSQFGFSWVRTDAKCVLLQILLKLIRIAFLFYQIVFGFPFIAGAYASFVSCRRISCEEFGIPNVSILTLPVPYFRSWRSEKLAQSICKLSLVWEQAHIGFQRFCGTS